MEAIEKIKLKKKMASKQSKQTQEHLQVEQLLFLFIENTGQKLQILPSEFSKIAQDTKRKIDKVFRISAQKAPQGPTK